MYNDGGFYRPGGDTRTLISPQPQHTPRRHYSTAHDLHPLKPSVGVQLHWELDFTTPLAALWTFELGYKCLRGFVDATYHMAAIWGLGGCGRGTSSDSQHRA
jgi:hypothetical protein